LKICRKFFSQMFWDFAQIFDKSNLLGHPSTPGSYTTPWNLQNCTTVGILNEFHWRKKIVGAAYAERSLKNHNKFDERGTLT